MTGCQGICGIYSVLPSFLPFFSACHREQPVTPSLLEGLMNMKTPLIKLRTVETKSSRDARTPPSTATAKARPGRGIGHPGGLYADFAFSTNA
jgi:hypothetical protein